MMINTQEFTAMRKELEAADDARETLIADSRSLLNLSKKAMYHTHRNDIVAATKVLEEATLLANKLKSAYVSDYRLKFGSVTAALQEWAESVMYEGFVSDQQLVSCQSLGLETEDYLLAACDLSGELVRRAVRLSIDKKLDDVQRIRVFLEELFGEFVSFNFRNGELRKKTDQVRWNLQKVEELLVRLS